ILSSVWLLNGDDLVRAGLVIGHGRNLRIQNLQIYDRGGGVLQRTIFAARAVPQPAANDWLLEDVRIYDANMNVISRQPQMPARPSAWRSASLTSSPPISAWRWAMPVPTRP